MDGLPRILLVVLGLAGIRRREACQLIVDDRRVGPQFGESARPEHRLPRAMLTDDQVMLRFTRLFPRGQLLNWASKRGLTAYTKLYKYKRVYPDRPPTAPRITSSARYRRKTSHSLQEWTSLSMRNAPSRRARHRQCEGATPARGMRATPHGNADHQIRQRQERVVQVTITERHRRPSDSILASDRPH